MGTQWSRSARPFSEATEFYETDIEDDASIFEEDSEVSTGSSCNSVRASVLLRTALG